MINFETNYNDSMTIIRIVERATLARPNLDGLILAMDLTACHLNGTPLDLESLSLACDMHFWHDIAGILRNMNRETGTLDNFFVPRYALGAAE